MAYSILLSVQHTFLSCNKLFKVRVCHTMYVKFFDRISGIPHFLDLSSRLLASRENSRRCFCLCCVALLSSPLSHLPTLFPFPPLTSLSACLILFPWELPSGVVLSVSALRMLRRRRRHDSTSVVMGRDSPPLAREGRLR